MSKAIYVFLYYKFAEVPNPEFETMQHKLVCEGIGLKGRIIIASEGINGTVAGSKAQLRKYREYMDAHPLFGDIVFKRSYSGNWPFKKMIVRRRDEIVTLGKKVDVKKSGKHISPEEFHKLIEQKEDVTIIDMRNDYEYKVGRFEGAIQPNTQRFFELPEKVKNLKVDKTKKALIYCTGGIRCEKAGAVLTEEGFEDVCQLDGGIVKYLEKYPNGYFKGKNFVFDQRMITNTETQSGKEVLAKCEHCQKPCDRFVDCADKSCHKLFICCKDCEKVYECYCTAKQKSIAIK